MQKKVIVIGGSSGIGRAISERFAGEGWQVMVASLDKQQCDAATNSLAGDGHLAVEVDVRADDQLERFSDIVAQSWGTFDVLINSTGVSKNTPVLNSGFTEWDNLIQVMLYGAVKVCRLLVPYLVNGGRIIHITSIHHERVASGSSAYGMAKAAITQLTRSLAVELAPRNILANTIAPGFVNTPMSLKADGRNELDSDWFKQNYVDGEHLPLKRAAEPAEIAGTAWFLAGNDSTYITGSVLTVDGGLTITF
jgi:NAD(P)-dependent dehydrogenase (short-subunit alcohol dehydrogenase family)